jgi:hypothetical protein
MKNFGKIIRGVGVAFLSTLWCTSPVWGDDTEIFFGAVDSSSARPNVLFIIDTSGSMSGSRSRHGQETASTTSRTPCTSSLTSSRTSTWA